jgi:hypothetical protein
MDKKEVDKIISIVLDCEDEENSDSDTTIDYKKLRLLLAELVLK